MKIKHILLQVKTLDEMAGEFKHVWKKASRGELIPAVEETICFESVEEMQKLLSPKRLRLLKTVHEKRPKSIYELAKILGRDRKNVTEDVKMFENVGLIERKPSKGNKEKVELIVNYDRIQLDIAV